MQVERGPLPPPLMTSEPGSFARKTIVERKPQILRDVSQAHPYPPQIQAGLEAFSIEILTQPIQPLREDAPDVSLWNEVWAGFKGRTWLDVPWYFAETFFYRRLMEIVRYYQPGPWQGIDPFAPQKAAELERALSGFIRILGSQFPDFRVAFMVLISDALWGNRADLSNRTISATADEGLLDRQADRLLIDDRHRVWDHLAGHRGGRVDIVADNSGLELLLDMRLADFLVRNGIARVRFHLKRMPFFVSDARICDLRHTLARLEASPPHGTALAERFNQAMARGDITLGDDPFWSTCFSYHQLPSHLRQELASSALVLLKGDVNYRRLLDDRHWPPTAHMAHIAAGFPAPFAALRTLKGELIVDLRPGQAEALQRADPTWMINGQRGIIQFVAATGHSE